MPDDIAAAFEAGKKRGVGANAMEAPLAHEFGKQLVREASEPQQYLAAAELLGFAYKIAQKNSFMGEQFDILDVLGSIYTRYPSTDSNMASIQASKLMRQAARGFVSIGEMRSAAIPFTNAAVALMEKSEISDSEFRMIKRFLDFGFEHKQPDTVDWAYSEAALGMYYSELRAISLEERIANLQKSNDAHERALNLFYRSGEVVSITAQTMVAKVARDLYRTKRAQRIADTLLAHISELSQSAQVWAADIPYMMAETIMTNPSAYGFVTAPDWLVEAINAPPSDEDVAMLQAARDRLLDAISDATGSDYTAQLECRWQAAEIDLDLLAEKDVYDTWLSLITTLANDFTPEQYIRRGARVIGLAHHVGEKPPIELLLKIAEAFGKITTQRDRIHLESFLRNNPALMRFVACDLCEQEQWGAAISVIENSRVLLYADHAEEARVCALASVSADPSNWVYITHYPKGTYIILGPECSNFSATGVFLSDLTGAVLSEIHFSFDDDSAGLMFAQSGGMSQYLTAATAKAFDILSPVADAIRALVTPDRGVCLILGGLYVTLPVSAALSADASASYPYVTVVLSRSQTADRSYSLPWGQVNAPTAMSVPEAPWLPNSPTLMYPDDEVDAVEKSFSEVGIQVTAVKNASIEDFQTAFERSNILHFSGHSKGMPFEPEYSSILLRNGPYSVGEILHDSPARHLLLATINSCQSGHQSTTVLADEFLGINTALLHRGCRFTLSTLWPVFDVVSYVMTSRFYSELVREDELNIYSLHGCLARTQSWVRTATASEIGDFFKGRGLNVPIMLENCPLGSVPFGHPRVWAAYYLSSRSL